MEKNKDEEIKEFEIFIENLPKREILLLIKYFSSLFILNRLISKQKKQTMSLK